MNKIDNITIGNVNDYTSALYEESATEGPGLTDARIKAIIMSFGLIGYGTWMAYKTFKDIIGK